MFYLVTDDNRREIERRYIDHIISHMDFMQIRDSLRSYLYSDKIRYSNLDLELEILRAAPEVFSESNIEPFLVGGGYQNA